MGLEGGVLERSLGNEGGALLHGIIALIKKRRDPQALPCSLFCHGRIQWDTSSVQRALSRAQRYWHPDLNLAGFRMVRNKFLLFRQPRLWSFVMAAGSDWHPSKTLSTQSSTCGRVASESPRDSNLGKSISLLCGWSQRLGQWETLRGRCIGIL